MGCSDTKTALMDWQGVSAISTTPVFIPAGGWRSAAGITAAKGTCELAGKTNQLQVTPAVQVANDIRTPGTATAVGQAISANGVSDPNGNTAVTTGSSRFIRPGWLVQLTSGATLSTGNVCGAIEFIY